MLRDDGDSGLVHGGRTIRISLGETFLELHGGLKVSELEDVVHPLLPEWLCFLWRERADCLFKQASRV